MTCFKNYIGLLECNSDTEPVSGLYINSLAGVSTELLQKISSREQATYAQAWSDIQDIAGRRFYTDVIGRLRKKYILKNVRQSLEFIPSATDATAEPASAQHRGIRLVFDYAYYTFQSFTIAKVPVLVDYTGDATLTVMDKNGTTLYQKTVALVAGLNLITVDKIFVSDEILLSLDFTDIDGYETSFAQGIVDAFCSACRVYCNDCNPVITGFTKVGDTVTATGRNTHGIGVIGYLGCDFASLLCNNKELLASAWMFLLGNQLTLHVLASNRTNAETTVLRKQYEDLKNFYQVEYEKALQDAVEGLVIDTENDCCVECNKNPRHVEWLP